MTVTPRHAPRDTCDEGLPMPTFLCFTENVYEGVSSDLINNFWFRIPLAWKLFVSLLSNVVGNFVSKEGKTYTRQSSKSSWSFL